MLKRPEDMWLSVSSMFRIKTKLPTEMLKEVYSSIERLKQAERLISLQNSTVSPYFTDIELTAAVTADQVKDILATLTNDLKPMDIKDIPTDQLEEELVRRRAKALQEKKDQRASLARLLVPIILENPQLFDERTFDLATKLDSNSYAYHAEEYRLDLEFVYDPLEDED